MACRRTARLATRGQETAPDWFEPLTALRLCRILLNPHSKDRTHRTVATRQHRRHTRSRLSAPHGLRGSRQGLHARAPAHQSDHTTWRGSEEADKARMRALPLTSPTTPHDRYWFLQTSLPMHRKPLLQPLPKSRTVPAPCIASLDELEPRPLYYEPELCRGRVEGDEQLAHRD